MDGPLTLESLSVRVERLDCECQRLAGVNRRLTRVVVLLLAGIGCTLLWPWQPTAVQAQGKKARTVEAERIVLLDDRGKVRAELGVGDSKVGLFGLRCYDAGGARRLVLGVNDKGAASLAMMDKTDGPPRLLLVLDERGPSVSAAGENGHRATLAGLPTGAALDLSHPEKKARLILAVEKDYSALSFTKSGKGDLMMGTTDRGPTLSVVSEKGATQVELSEDGIVAASLSARAVELLRPGWGMLPFASWAV